MIDTQLKITPVIISDIIKANEHPLKINIKTFTNILEH